MIKITHANADRPGPPTILVADDTAITREVAKSLLARAGFQTLDVGDGATALDLLHIASVDALVADIEMPNVPGDELIERLRNGEIPVYQTIPIVVISSKSDGRTRVTLRRLGANAFLAKPLSGDSLPRTVQQVLELN